MAGQLLQDTEDKRRIKHFSLKYSWFLTVFNILCRLLRNKVKNPWLHPTFSKTINRFDEKIIESALRPLPSVLHS